MRTHRPAAKPHAAIPRRAADRSPQTGNPDNPLWRAMAMRSPKPALQAQLAVGDHDDEQERQADRVAAQVMRMPQDEGLLAGGDAIRRVCTECDERPARSARRAAAGDGGSLSPATAVSIQTLRGGGQPLPPGERAFFEPRFAADFGKVRVHTDGRADRAAEALGARAFTLGHDVAFRAGEYRPGSDRGRQLLAHELTHVIQQRAAAPVEHSQVVRAQPSETGDPAPGPTLVLRKPPHFPQNNAGCWASAIASWRVVKGLDTGITDETLIKSYKGTDCTDQVENWLIGDSNADIEAVFGEWRLLLDLSTTVDSANLTFDHFKSLLERHGHFLLITGDPLSMHARVVYGIRHDNRNDAGDFTLLVEDPLSSETEVHALFLADARIAVGMEKRSGVPPCRTRPPR